MALDPSIILQAGRGVTPLLTPQEIEEQKMTRELGNMKIQQARQGMMDDQALRSVYAQGGDIGQALQQKGLYKPAMEYQKFQSDQQKAQADRGKAAAEGMKQGANMILANPTEENAIRTLTETAQLYGLPQQMVDSAKARIYAARNDPNQLRQLAAGWGADAEKVLGKFSSVNMGATQEQQRVNPVTGQMEVAGVQQRTQTPDSMAVDARMREQTSLMREQADAGKVPPGYRRTPDGNLEFIPGGPADPSKKTSSGKPLPAAALKLQQEALDSLSISRGIDTDLGALEKQIGEGKLQFGPVRNLANQARNAAGVSTEESRNFASFRSTLEKLRNDSLRLNKGVQTEGDAQRAWNELFQNINDTPMVQQRLAEIRNINQRAANLQRMNIDNIRMNYGHDPLDTTGYENQPAALGGGQGGPSSATEGKQPSSKTIKVQGQEMRAELAPDGKYYVQRNGKWFEVR